MIAVTLTTDAIDPQSLVAQVASEGCGAISIFLGTVRDHNEGRAVKGIEYSAYDAMAAKEMRAIAEEAASRCGTERIAVVHRLGELALGDVSVAIAVAAAHRAPAFDAARYIIEELKKRVPIWKRELYTDGTREWVDPTRWVAEASP
jgi:molybdopterin synthase catalytic subunit